MSVHPIAEGLYRIVLPLPWELETINVYLVAHAEGWLLIDCGIHSPASRQALEVGLAAAGAPWRSVRQLLLSHYHPDHVGLAGEVLALTGAELWMHRADAARLEELAAGGGRLDWVRLALQDAGVPPALQQDVDFQALGLANSFPHLRPDRFLEGGERLETALGPLEVHWTPGHSPGHVCLWAPQPRYLFSGDHILEDITPNIGWYPDLDPLGDYLTSLEESAGLDAALLLPSHGEPFAGHKDWVRQTLAHHQERCDAILAALRARPATAHELVAALWQRKLSPFHHRFAVFEVLAHLEYLRRRGHCQSRRDGVPLRWFAG